MEGMGGFPYAAEFDLLRMFFPGNDPDGTCSSLSQYSMVDDESPYAVHDVCVNTMGLYEDYSYCSLVDVDSSFQWSSGFYLPAADLSTIVNSGRIRDEISKDDSHVQTADSMPPEGHFVAGKASKHKRKSTVTGESANTAVEISDMPKKRPRQDMPKKRPRQSRIPQKRQEGARMRRNRKSSDVVDNETNDNKNSGDGENLSQERQSPKTSCSSEDDVNSQQLSASDDLNLKASSAPNNNGATEVKPRAGRGAATDPQSLYARKRRERINERLKILQKIIPNGTKVDISTMLEEVVHYVKFLQLQIKLLSSDEMWKYAPIAYNGKDIALDRLFSSQL